MYDAVILPNVCINYGNPHCVYAISAPNVFVHWFFQIILGRHQSTYFLFAAQNIRERTGQWSQVRTVVMHLLCLRHVLFIEFVQFQNSDEINDVVRFMHQFEPITIRTGIMEA